MDITRFRRKHSLFFWGKYLKFYAASYIGEIKVTFSYLIMMYKCEINFFFIKPAVFSDIMHKTLGDNIL